MVLYIFVLLISIFVYCEESGKQGDVKLWHSVDESNFNFGSSGNTLGYGILLVYNENEWGSVCDNGFSQESANVVCRQIGWARAEKVAVYTIYFIKTECPRLFNKR